MFYLSGGGNLSRNPKTDTEDEFGWYLSEHEQIEEKIYNNPARIVRLPQSNGNNPVKATVTGFPSMDSTTSIVTSIDSEEPKNLELPEDSTKRQNGDETDSATVENIEMNSFERSNNLELDLDMIEGDTDHVFTSAMRSSRDESDFLKTENETDDGCPRALSYTPERLVRSQEYRILTPSPRYYAIPRSIPNNIDSTIPRRYRGHRRRLGDLIDIKEFGGSHLEALLDPLAPEVRLPVANRRRPNYRDRISSKKIFEEDSGLGLQEPLTIANRASPIAFETPDLVSGRSSYERLNNSWYDATKTTRRSSQEDTSGIHSSDWSMNTPSDIHTSMCLCDELSAVSKCFINGTESRSRGSAINEVVSILEGLERDPDRAAILLEEDRCCEAISGHDHLTRLALSIEPDGVVPLVAGDPDSLLTELRTKVERLQEASKDIFKDIDDLREDFQYNETKVDDLIDGTISFRQDMHEMRYLDDLLNLLDGELERISRRNWPFVFGHSEHRAEEMNLVI